MAEFSSLNGYAVKDTVARNIAKGRNQALAYSNYEAMVDALNTMDNDEFKTGQNIYIGTVGVPDLWVYTVEPVRNTFGYVSDEAIVELLKNNGTIQVGYYKLAMLEGQKVDLTPVNEQLADHTNAIAANTNAISEQNKKIVVLEDFMNSMPIAPTYQTGSGTYSAGRSSYSYYSLNFPEPFAEVPEVSIETGAFDWTATEVTRLGFKLGLRRNTDGSTISSTIKWIAAV